MPVILSINKFSYDAKLYWLTSQGLYFDVLGFLAGMVDKLDESVGLVIEALSRKKMLSNSIIVFASDNGGAPEGFDLNYSSNWPLRGVMWFMCILIKK